MPFGIGKGSGSGSTTSMTERTHLLQAEQSIFRSLRGGSGSISPTDEPDSGLTEGNNARPGAPVRTLGTFEGVFAPVSLSMLSSILFLRVGYIVGNAGLPETLLQLAIAYTILVATVLSICAIATNGAVEGGGVYFMISRTMGMEFGGAIGILFWFGNIVSSALYLSACVEGMVGSFGPDGSLSHTLPAGRWWNFLYCSVLNLVNFVVCIFGAKIFGRASTFILAVVCACTLVTMASFFAPNTYEHTYVYNATKDCIPPTDNVSMPNCTKTVNGSFIGLLAGRPGYIGSTFKAHVEPKFEFDCSDAKAEVSFFTVFGVLFSGVTGIMSGANMSGELLSPGRSIPTGTLGACLFTLSILTSMSLLTALTCTPSLVLHDCMYLTEFSLWTPIVTIGVFFATFSASLNNLIGASRILEAVGRDVLVGQFLAFFARGTMKDNPVLAIFVSFVLVEVFLLMGSLNSIAQLSSVLFLLSYASVNVACLGLDLASAPNFRPTFKYFSWHTCLIGFLGTATMMFLVSPMFSAIGILLCLSLVFALNVFMPIRKENWGSISQALLFHQVRKYLLLLDPRKAHVKFWRPQILLLVSNPRTSCSLIDFVNSLKKGGLYVLGHVYKEKLKRLDKDPCAVHQNAWLSLIDHLKVKAFVELTLAESLREGIQHLVRISGIGAMKANTIILGFLDSTFHGDDFLSPSSPYTSAQFEGLFPPLVQLEAESDHEGKEVPKRAPSMSKVEFVGIICDLLKMEKNVCLSRHFQQLNRCAIFRADKQSIFGTRVKRKQFLDVWLVDFFSPATTDISDTTSLFLLQLACIVNMTQRWKKMRIRVFISVDDLDEEVVTSKERIVRHMLDLLRIRAEPQVSLRRHLFPYASKSF